MTWFDWSRLGQSSARMAFVGAVKPDAVDVALLAVELDGEPPDADVIAVPAPSDVTVTVTVAAAAAAALLSER